MLKELAAVAELSAADAAHEKRRLHKPWTRSRYGDRRQTPEIEGTETKQ